MSHIIQDLDVVKVLNLMDTTSTTKYWFTINKNQCSYLQYYKEIIIINPPRRIYELPDGIKLIPADNFIRRISNDNFHQNHGDSYEYIQQIPDVPVEHTNTHMNPPTDQDRHIQAVLRNLEKIKIDLINMKHKVPVWEASMLEREDDTEGKFSMKGLVKGTKQLNKTNSTVYSFSKISDVSEDLLSVHSVHVITGRKLLSIEETDVDNEDGDDLNSENSDIGYEGNIETIDEKRDMKDSFEIHQEQNNEPKESNEGSAEPKLTQIKSTIDCKPQEGKVPSSNEQKGTVTEKKHNQGNEDVGEEFLEENENHDDDHENYDYGADSDDSYDVVDDEDEDDDYSDDTLEEPDILDIYDSILNSSATIEVKLNHTNQLLAQILDTETAGEDETELFEEILVSSYYFIRFISEEYRNESSYDKLLNETSSRFFFAAGKVFPVFKSFVYFTQRSWDPFIRFTEQGDLYNTKHVFYSLTNDFMINYHYAAEILKIILKRKNENEIILTAEAAAKVNAMKDFNVEVLQFKRQLESKKDKDSFLHDYSQEEEEDEYAKFLLESDYEDYEDYDEIREPRELEPNDMETEEDSDDYRVSFQLRSLLSIEEEFCTKDDPDSTEKEKNNFKADPDDEFVIKDEKVVVKKPNESTEENEVERDNAKTDNLKDHFSDPAFISMRTTTKKPIKSTDKKMSNKPSLFDRCMKLLRDFEENKERQKKLQKAKKGNVRTEKEKLALVRQFVEGSKATQMLFERYQAIEAELQTAEYSDRLKSIHIQYARVADPE